MNNPQHPLNALPQGHRLQEYELVRVLGFGGFGMTYLGFDHNLDKGVAIKEYLPADIATRTADNSVAPQASRFRHDFDWGLERFLDEARTLARFDHRHLVKVFRFFEAHGTAYIVMEYAEGETLSAFLQRKRTLDEAELKAILYPVLDGLEVVHGADFLHRDIKPGNIIIRGEDNSPVLLDFGAARQAIGARSRSVTSIITPGYAPIEQYSSRGEQGPWTDIYALEAVCYHALTGETPYDATDRVRNDPLVLVSERCAGQASEEFLAAIDWSLKVDEGDRPQCVAEWRDALRGKRPVPPPVVKPPKRGPLPPRRTGSGIQPPVRRKKKRSGAVFATFLCGFALLIGGGYYYYEYILFPEQRRQEKQRALLAAEKAERRRQEAERARLAEEEAERLRQSKLAEYEGKFVESMGREEFHTAGRYVDSLRALDVDSSELSELTGRLSKAREHATGRVFRDCAECPRMVIVPLGSFMMGSPGSEKGRYEDEGPRHRVRIDYRFAVGVYEVTFAEWDACTNAGSCGGYRPKDGGWGRGNRPVISVNWDDAQSYVRWLSQETGEEYRLLSESEWEFVARAGTTTSRYWGDSSMDQCRYGNGADLAAKQHQSSWTVASCDDGYYRTSPVGTYVANRYGLYDALGNVWEWVADCWNDSYAGAPADGSAWERGDCSKRVLRGGSLNGRPRVLRSAVRYRNSSGSRYFYIGFRVARTIENQ